MFIIELIYEFIVDSWLDLMLLIVPKNMANKKVRFVLKAIVYIFCAIIYGIMLISIFALFSEDEIVRIFAKKAIMFSLSVSAVQILIGIIVRFITKKRKK